MNNKTDWDAVAKLPDGTCDKHGTQVVSFNGLRITAYCFCKDCQNHYREATR